MGRRLCFDIEADSLQATRVWCVVAQDLDTGEVHEFDYRSLSGAVLLLGDADELWGHNITNFDLPTLDRVLGFSLPERTVVYDTLCASRQAYPGKELAKRDFVLIRRGTMPTTVHKKPHALEAWGYRLGLPKSSYEDFSVYTPAMLAYCRNDVALNVKIVEHLLKRTPKEVIALESAVQRVLQKQSADGVGFDTSAAVKLTAELAARREALAAELRSMYKPWYAPSGKVSVPKRDNVKRGIGAGWPYQNIKQVEFNPASNQHVVRVLQKTRGWEPHDFTDNGQAKVEEKILADLPWPECKLLVEYQRLKKILGYLSEGDNAWLKLERDGSLHPRVHATGTVTNRMSHVEPNLAQVPKVGKPFGKECRALFVARPGYVLVGADASGLQLRMLAHYLAPYDGGTFARLIEEGGDVHTYMQEGTGIIRRDNSKTAHYAWLFGAGHYKLGTIAIFDFANAKELGLWDGEVPSLKRAVTIGTRVKRGLEEKLQMQGMAANLKRCAQRGFLRSLDGRSIPVLSQHKALNTLLMGGEAVVMKHALLRAKARLGWVAPKARFVLNVHDEWQVEAPPDEAQLVGEVLVDCIRETGEQFNLRVKLDGQFKVGPNWSETQ